MLATVGVLADLLARARSCGGPRSAVRLSDHAASLISSSRGAEVLGADGGRVVTKRYEQVGRSADE
jgi:hypothetical protein